MGWGGWRGNGCWPPPLSCCPLTPPLLPFTGRYGTAGVPWDARGAWSEGGEGECQCWCGEMAHAVAPPSSHGQLGYARKPCSLLCARVTQAWGQGDRLDHPVPQDCQDPPPSTTSWWVPPGTWNWGHIEERDAAISPWAASPCHQAPQPWPSVPDITLLLLPRPSSTWRALALAATWRACG